MVEPRQEPRNPGTHISNHAAPLPAPGVPFVPRMVPGSAALGEVLILGKMDLAPTVTPTWPPEAHCV